MGMSGNGNRGDGKNGNGNDSMEVGREWEQESHSCTPLVMTAITDKIPYKENVSFLFLFPYIMF